MFETTEAVFPDAAGAAAAHRRHPAIPGIEIADHAHAFRIRRPHAEMNPAHAGYLAHMRTELLVIEVVRALA
jgi:hypothetical protein